MDDILAGLMSRSMDDIADLPTYAAPPKGIYRLRVRKSESDKIDLDEKRKQVPAWQMEYEIVEVMKLDDETKAGEVKVGQIFQETYLFLEKPELTLGAMKLAFSKLAVEMGEGNLVELCQKLPEMEVVGYVNNRQDKSKEKTFARCENLELAK